MFPALHFGNGNIFDVADYYGVIHNVSPPYHLIGRLYHRKEVREIMNGLIQSNKTITSLEVAEMVGKRHDHLIRDIKKYIGELSHPNFGDAENPNEGEIPYVEFFKESSYVDAQSKKRLCYDITKKGCEFIAHKLTGIKGTKFTARYINRFHDMEDYIKQGNSKNLY